jgi:hypothetical protein
MKISVQSLQVKFADDANTESVQFRDRPVLRYSDPARGMFDATVWRMGDRGRPDVLVAMEITRKQDTHLLNYEFLSLTGRPLALSSGPFTWKPMAGMLQWKSLPDGPVPADKEQLRGLQMRKLAQRFSGTELYHGERSELRMLPQPIDRYVPGKQPNSDAAMFAFVYGTNPEIVLFIETDGSAWSFAAGRLSAAASWLMLDGKEVWQQEAVKAPDPMSPYVSNRHPVVLPSAEGTP